MMDSGKPRKDWLRSALVRLTSSAAAQRLLERRLRLLLALMGIGSGGGAAWSGESGLGRLLRAQHAAHRSPLVIFDVGSNAGQFIKQVADPLAASGLPMHIHAFEPGAAAFGLLRSNFSGRSDVTLNNMALGRERGQAELFLDTAGSEIASLSRRRLDHFGIQFTASEQVRVETLDDYCASRDITRIDLLKLDVEGHELDVLHGGRRMLRESRIAILSFEFGGADIDSRTFFQDFWYFFRDNGGGMLHRLTPSGRLFPIRAYSETHEQFLPTVFVVLFPGAVNAVAA